MQGQAAVVGIGETTYYKRGDCPVSEFQLACTAIQRAVADAGLRLEDIDGIVSYMDQRNDPLRLGNALGLKRLTWSATTWGGGGNNAAAAVQLADAAISAGYARNVVALPDHTFYVALIHPANTSAKQCSGPRWSAYAGDMAHIMGEDIHFYRRKTVSVDQEAKQGLKLNLGCCDALLPGFVNVDRIPAPGVEVADLREPWPWPDSAVGHIRAWDIIEHLPDKIHTMNEMWRVLIPGGTAEIAVPTTDGTGAFQDQTHVSFWNRSSFLYYEVGNPYRERFARHYGIEAKFRTLREQIDQSVDGPRLTILLQAVKP